MERFRIRMDSNIKNKMTMKTIKSIFAVSMLLAGGMTLVSCSDTNDWDTDGSYSRLFSMASDDIKVEAEDTYATISFAGIKNTQYYVIELSTDTLYDDIPLGGTDHSRVFGQNKDITPGKAVIVKGLTGDTKYYLRIKGCSDGVADSRWTYNKNGAAFKTKAEQIFDETASVVNDNNVTVYWDPAKEVTNIVVTDADGNPVANYDLSDTDKANGSFEIQGLSPTTTYIITIYNGEDKRGQLRVTTPAAIPDADFKYFLASEVTVISQELMNQISDEAIAAGADPSNYSVTVAIPAGVKLDMVGEDAGQPADVKIPNGMSVTFFGMAGGPAPELSPSRCVNVEGSHAFVRFENMKLTDGGCQYLINQGTSATLGELTFKDCVLDGFARSIVRLKDNAVTSIGKLNVENTIISNQGKGSYATFYFNNAAYTVEEINITNSTFNTLQHNVIACSGANVRAINISNVTLYNVIGGGRYFVDANGVNVEVKVSNTIFAKTFSDTARGVRSGGTTTFVDCYMTSDFILGSNKFEVDNMLEETSAGIFQDPENGNFTLKASFKAGDPRWIPVED